MTDRPILFSGPMVRAILEGRKTQTRPLIPQTHPNFPDLCHIRTDVLSTGEPWYWGGKHDRVGASLPSFYAPGDRLWVRETCAIWDGGHRDVVYRATESEHEWSALKHDAANGAPWKIRNSNFMPKWVSRITLVVTDVRVQRLQDISEADAKAEGVQPIGSDNGPDPDYRSYVWAFQHLWDSLNAKRAPWGSNPWVVAITFNPHLCNIDQMEPAQ